MQKTTITVAGNAVAEVADEQFRKIWQKLGAIFVCAVDKFFCLICHIGTSSFHLSP